MFDFGSLPNIFWIFAGIALIVLAKGYVKSMQQGASPSKEVQEELSTINDRLDHIETHLDIRSE